MSCKKTVTNGFIMTNLVSLLLVISNARSIKKIILLSYRHFVMCDNANQYTYLCVKPFIILAKSNLQGHIQF